MASASVTLTTVRSDLGAAFEEFDLDANSKGFVASRVLRPFPVKNQRGIFGRVKMESLLATKNTLRASGSGYNRDSWEFEDETYACQEHGFEGVVDDRDKNTYRDLIDAEMVTAKRLRHIVMQNAEIRVANLIQSPSVFNTVGITDEWDDLTAAIPITNVEGAVNRLWAKGIVANALIITRNQYRNLRLCKQVIDKVVSGGAGSSELPGNINIDTLKKAFDLEHIIVAGGVQNIANDGLAGSYSGIWSDEYAAVCRIADSDDIIEPCIGRTMHWDEDGGEYGGVVEDYYDDRVRGTVYRVRHDVDEKIIHAAACELLSNAITI